MSVRPTPEPAPVLNITRPFTPRDAAAAGLDPKRLRRLGHSPVLRGVWISSSVVVDTRVRALATLLVAGPDSWIRGRTAARLWRGIGPDDGRTHVGLPITGPTSSPRRLRIEGVAASFRPRPDRLILDRDVRLTPPSATLVELAAELSLVDLVVLGDSLVRRQATTPERLRAAARADRSRSGPRARRAAGPVRERVDSPKETRLRVLLVLAGLPEPVVDLRLRDEDGHVVRRLDLAYEAERIAIEFDGRHHIERQDRWVADIDRREELEAQGWLFVVLTSGGVHGDAARTVDRVAAALARRGRTVRTRGDWRQHLMP